MKVCISNSRQDWSTVKTGKGRFVQRLITALANRGVCVTTDPEVEVDITLGIGKFDHPIKSGKAVLRLGDAHKDTNTKWKRLNFRKKKALGRADGVIYQSEYSKKLCHAFLGKTKSPETVIFNGADPNEFDVEPYKSPYKYNFLASARVWTKQKRLKQIERAFLDAKITNSCLYICGTVDKKRRTKGIKYLGLVDQKTLASLYKLCNAMIDITYLSACPNNVVEALVAGCKVICTLQGGTAEIVHPMSEMAIVKDQTYDFKPFNMKKVPKIDETELARTIKRYTWEGSCKANHLHIREISRQYYSFFERILDE